MTRSRAALAASCGDVREPTAVVTAPKLLGASWQNVDSPRAMAGPRYSATVQTRCPRDSEVTAQAALGKRQSLVAVQRGRHTRSPPLSRMQVPLLGHSADWAAAAVQRSEQKRTVRDVAPLVRVLERQSRVSLWQGWLGPQGW